MPAIVLSRLRQQASLLAGHFSQPAAFVRSLSHLLEFYADRTQRPGKSGAPAPLLPAFNVPAPVLRQVLSELVPLAEDSPEEALALCDALWHEGYLEYRLLATSLLGKIPPKPPEAVILRVDRWAQESFNEERMLTEILTQGLERLRKEHPEEVLELVENWLGDEDLACQKLGLRALPPLFFTSVVENLPVILRLITPFVRSASADLRPDILDVLISLARLSPKESAHFLRRSLQVEAEATWLVRQCLSEFPEDLQESLRQALRNGEKG